jgi:fimbrial chaperone protein
VNRSVRTILPMILVVASVSLAYAGALKVVPTTLFLARGKKTEVLKITNTGAEPVTIQVEAMKWVQGHEGKDVFDLTGDIVYFPKIFTVESGKNVLLRIGLKEAKIAEKEMSYRVFLQEIPVAGSGGSQLTLTLRLGIPIFIKPVKEQKEWTIEKAELSDDLLKINIKNTGTDHIIVGKLKARGLDTSNQEIFKREASGWYVLPDVVRSFPINIPGKECLNSAAIEVTAEVEGSHKETTLNVDKALCPKLSDQPANKGKAGK